MHIIIFVTASNKKEAVKIAKSLIKNRLAACVNISDKIKSFFWWKVKIDKADEALLIIKSNRKKFPKIIQLVKSMHSYEVPEIIALPIIDADKEYLKWIDDSLRKPH
jgi:periplasmic divalent cation tolerance protein